MFIRLFVGRPCFLAHVSSDDVSEPLDDVGNAANGSSMYGADSGEENAAADNSMETPATPASAPREYVVGLYNSYAETFDSHLQGALEYRTPTVVVDNLRRLFPGRT